MNEEEAQNLLFIPPATQLSVEPVHAFNIHEPQPQLQPSFEFNALAISQSQQEEAPSVLTCDLDQHALQSQFSEDFLEIKDLIGTPELNSGYIEKPVENSTSDEVNGLSELDLFHDAAMFLHDIGPLDQGNITAPDMNLFDYGMLNESTYQVQQCPLLFSDQSTDLLGVHDQRGDAYASLESIQGVQLHPSGTLFQSQEFNQLT